MTRFIIPITMGEGGSHCDPQCPHLKLPADVYSLEGECKRDGKPLDFHDWYLAHCKEQET